ncbi:MAG TPA: hypothetical protein VHW94_09505, partial [Candidatus Dormibacteraeota bacterium]|nr:hypothetical protein [Candidatus Dormibacteraeota bacterium]
TLRYTGAFLTFPAAASTADPTGSFTGDSSYQLTTDTAPTLHGGGVLSGAPAFYDRAQLRWVPASPSQSTPDGAFYAYSTWDGANPSQAKVHIVDVRQATESVFDLAVPSYAKGFTVADFASEGVYLVANQFEQLPNDVWLMNPSTGALSRLAKLNFVAAVRNGYAWAARIDPRDPSPPQLGGSGTVSDSIVRVDLTTGAQTIWFYRPRIQVELMGFDSSGAPLIQVGDVRGSSASLETWLVASPGRRGILIHRGEPFLWNPQGDGDRIWFGGNLSDGTPSAVYLFTKAHGLQRVFGLPQIDQSVIPAGVCS